MQLRQLRYLIHVAEIGSFSKAGQHLRVAQPALSRQIRLLEEELGVQLLYRDGRGAKLTSAGQDLYERSLKLFKQMSEMREAVIAHKDVLDGEVTVGVPPSVGTVLIPPAIVRCMDLHPQLAIKVMESSNIAVLEEWLLSDRIDMAIVNGAAPISKSLVTTRLLSEPIHLIGPAEEGLQDEIELRDVVGLPLILGQPRHGLRMLLNEACAPLGLEFDVRVEVDSVAMMKRLVALGAGYAVLPESVVTAEEGKGLSVRRIVEPEIRRDLLIAHAAERPPAPTARAFQEVIWEIARQTYGAACCLDPPASPTARQTER